MPYVAPEEALNAPSVDIEAIRREMGPAPWRRPLVATPAVRMVLIEWPAGYVTVPHRHPRAVETFQVLRGRAAFRFGGDDADRGAAAGQVLHAPRDVMHAIGVPDSQGVTLLCTVTPNEDSRDETIEDPAAPTPRV